MITHKINYLMINIYAKMHCCNVLQDELTVYIIKVEASICSFQGAIYNVDIIAKGVQTG